MSTSPIRLSNVHEKKMEKTTGFFIINKMNLRQFIDDLRSGQIEYLRQRMDLDPFSSMDLTTLQGWIQEKRQSQKNRDACESPGAVPTQILPSRLRAQAPAFCPRKTIKTTTCLTWGEAMDVLLQKRGEETVQYRTFQHACLQKLYEFFAFYINMDQSSRKECFQEILEMMNEMLTKIHRSNLCSPDNDDTPLIERYLPHIDDPNFRKQMRSILRERISPVPISRQDLMIYIVQTMQKYGKRQPALQNLLNKLRSDTNPQNIKKHLKLHFPFFQIMH